MLLHTDCRNPKPFRQTSWSFCGLFLLFSMLFTWQTVLVVSKKHLFFVLINLKIEDANFNSQWRLTCVLVYSSCVSGNTKVQSCCWGSIWSIVKKRLIERSVKLGSNVHKVRFLKGPTQPSRNPLRQVANRHFCSHRYSKKTVSNNQVTRWAIDLKLIICIIKYLYFKFVWPIHFGVFCMVIPYNGPNRLRTSFGQPRRKKAILFKASMYDI